MSRILFIGGSIWAGTPPLGRYNTPGQVHPPGKYPPVGTPPGQVPPGSSACWEIQATSGQHESYWNAFLFMQISGGNLTALFTKPSAPFMAYGSFRNCTRQNHGTAGNREAGGFVNSTVRLVVVRKSPLVRTQTEQRNSTSK